MKFSFGQFRAMPDQPPETVSFQPQSLNVSDSVSFRGFSMGFVSIFKFSCRFAFDYATPR